MKANTAAQANAICMRVRLLSKSLRTERQRKNHEFARALVLNALSIGCMWRELVDLLSEDDDIDYRTIGAVLVPAADKSVENCRLVTTCAEGFAATLPPGEISELRLIAQELQSIQEWLSTWPTFDRTHRDIARKQIRNGETRPIEEFVAELETES